MVAVKNKIGGWKDLFFTHRMGGDSENGFSLSHSLMGLTVLFVSCFNERGNGVAYITCLGCYL